MTRKHRGGRSPPVLSAPLTTRYCAECRWLRVSRGTYWCVRRRKDLGDFIAGTEACRDFSPRRSHDRRPAYAWPRIRRRALRPPAARSRAG